MEKNKLEFEDQRILKVDIEDEMKTAYLDYSMSVIVSRALPDVRDGLKPVHRRIMFGMSELNLTYQRAPKKCARIVGEVLGKYHPHGDSSVYDALVRMAQDFSMRYPLVQGQGNFGSIDGDSAAAMRYTEARMAKISKELLADIEKETVDFSPNFDETLMEPNVLPARVPFLLTNGSSGIAVGMATNIPPHNLTEVVDATIYQIDHPDCEIEELMTFVKGPDFPTAGIIMGKGSIKEAYETGKGIIKIRGRAEIDEMKNGKMRIIITELPYQVNKAKLIKTIADLVKNKIIDGITDLRDESGRSGIRVVLELRKNIYPEVILNQLYSHTQLEESFGINLLALVKGVPKRLNLKQVLTNFIEFRHEVIVKRTIFDLNKAEAKAHILEGLKIALENIDEVIKIIRGSKNPEDAKEQLIATFNLSELQSKAILDMRLQKLTSLEVEKVIEEYNEVMKLIERLKFILANVSEQYKIIKDEMIEIRDTYGDKRLTEITADSSDFSIEDMIAEEDMVITISDSGFIKRSPIIDYKKQKRGGRGTRGAMTKNDDFIKDIFIASTHDYILFLTNKGRCYWLKVHEIPLGGRNTRGRAVVNLIQVKPGEVVKSFISTRDFPDDKYMVIATKEGLVKKTELSKFSKPRVTGIQAIGLKDGDEIVNAAITDGDHYIILGSSYGKSIKFHERDCRPMGRSAFGVRGIRLVGKGNIVVEMVATQGEEGTLLAICENGFGKRTAIEDYPVIKRGGVGVITIKTSIRNGKMLSLLKVNDEDDLMIITQNGVLIRLGVSTIRSIARNTQGVKLIKLDDDDAISAVTRVARDDDGEDDFDNENGVEQEEIEPENEE
ncbi:MAG: DNA gyrase subunit A [Candidatus Marinimicrobia bacterium]|nr:DNA gyrase subunit A [Candidatus Neomarinimicrobiota bacterium]